MLGISPDEVEAIAKFDDKYDLGFTLLADPDHAVAEQYGAWGEKSMYGKKYMGVLRSTFIVDPEGKIAQVFPKVQPKKHDDLVLKALASSPGVPLSFQRALRRCSALSAHDDDDDEATRRARTSRHRGQFEAPAQVQALVGEQAAGDAEADREDRVAAQRPSR